MDLQISIHGVGIVLAVCPRCGCEIETQIDCGGAYGCCACGLAHLVVDDRKGRQALGNAAWRHLAHIKDQESVCMEVVDVPDGDGTTPVAIAWVEDLEHADE